MLFASCATPVAVENNSSQNATTPTNSEILSRVLQIQSGWSEQEKIDRQVEADRRFAALLDVLIAADTIAADTAA